MIDFDQSTAVLVAIRKCKQSPVSTVVRHRLNGSPIKIVINILEEIDPLELDLDSIEPSVFSGVKTDLSLMNVSGFSARELQFDFEVSSTENKSPQAKRKILDDMERTPKRKKKDHIDEIIESVVAGFDVDEQPTVQPISLHEFFVKKLLNDIENLNLHQDLASLLPGEKMPEFKY